MIYSYQLIHSSLIETPVDDRSRSEKELIITNKQKRSTALPCSRRFFKRPMNVDPLRTRWNMKRVPSPLSMRACQQAVLRCCGSRCCNSSEFTIHTLYVCRQRTVDSCAFVCVCVSD